jgi:hypothetical protein
VFVYEANETDLRVVVVQEKEKGRWVSRFIHTAFQLTAGRTATGGRLGRVFRIQKRYKSDAPIDRNIAGRVF